MEYTLFIKWLTCVVNLMILIVGVAECRNRRFPHRGPHTCGPPSDLRCCQGWIASRYTGLCIHRCRQCETSHNGRSQHQRFQSDSPHVDKTPAHSTRHQHHSSNTRIQQQPFHAHNRHQEQKPRTMSMDKTPTDRREEEHLSKPSYSVPAKEPRNRGLHNPRGFFRPHITSSTGIQERHHMMPKIGYRTIPKRRTHRHMSQIRHTKSKSASKWSEHFKSRSRPNIRRVYDKNGKVHVLTNPQNQEGSLETTTKSTKDELRRYKGSLPTRKSFTQSRTDVSKDQRDIAQTNQRELHMSSIRKIVSTGPVTQRHLSNGLTKTTTSTPYIVGNNKIANEASLQADEPLRDLDVSSDDEVVLSDLVVDLPTANASNRVSITETNSSTTVEELEVICRGDLCLQKQRLLKHNSTSTKDYLDPSEVACPPGYFKAVRENIIVCEAYRKSVKRKGIVERTKNKKKNKKKKKKKRKQKKTTVSPEEATTALSTGSTTAFKTAPERTSVKSDIAFSARDCPPGQIKTNRGDLTLCIDDTSEHTTKPGRTDGTGNTCAPGQKSVLKNGQTFCETDGTVVVTSTYFEETCPRGQKSVQRNNRVFCEVEGSVEAETTLTVTPDSSNEVRFPCPRGQVPILTSSGFICATPPDSDVNTSVESGKTRVACPDGATPVTVDGHLVCQDSSETEIVEPRNGICPDGYSLTVVAERPVCKRNQTNFMEPTNGKCHPNYSLVTINDKLVCQRIGIREVDKDFIDPDNDSCPEGYTLVTVNGRSSCKRSYDVSKENTDIIDTMNGGCPPAYSLRTINGKYVCKKKDMELVDETEFILPENGECSEGYTLITYHRKLVCKKNEERIQVGRDIVDPINGRCSAGYSMSTVNRRLVCVKDKQVTQEEVTRSTVARADFVQPVNDDCPSGYILTTLNGDEICRRLQVGIDYLLPESGACPTGSTLTTVADRLICKKDSKDDQAKTLDCPKGQKRVKENGRTICKSSTHREIGVTPDLACPPGYRMYKGLCEDEKLILILMETENNLECPDGQVLAERNNMFYCENETVATQSPITPTRCPPGQYLISKNGQTFCEIEMAHTTTEASRGDSDITSGISGPLTAVAPTTTPVCSVEQIQVIRDGQIFCEQIETTTQPPSTTLRPCHAGQRTIRKNGKTFCELPGGVLIEVFPDVASFCPDGTTPIERNGKRVCRDGSTPKCPRGTTPVSRNGRQLCRKSDRSIPRKPRLGPPSTKQPVTTVCPPGQTKIVRNNEVVCDTIARIITPIDIGPTTLERITPLTRENIDCPEGYTEVIEDGSRTCLPEENNPVTREGESHSDCPKGYVKVALRNGKYECELDINAGETREESCPNGYKKIVLRNGNFDCEREEEDCPEGYKKVILSDGDFDCEIDESGDCPVGYRKVYLQGGAFDCEIDGSEICPPGYRRVTRRDGSFDCEVITTDCPEGFTRKWRLNRYLCEPDYSGTRDNNGETGSDWVDPSLVDCPPGYHRALRDNILVCEALRGSILAEANITCASNELLAFTDDGPRCVIFRCNDSEELVVVEDVRFCKTIATTTQVPICPPEMEVVRTESGYICVYKEITTTTIRTTTISCPEGGIRVHTDQGIRCIRLQIHKPTSTESPCAEGLTAVRTAVGTICVLRQSTTTTTSAPTSCPEGQVLMETVDGEGVCGFESFGEVTCARGQIEIYTLDGQIVCKNIQDLSAEENPCPLGLEIVETENGAECKYPQTSVHGEHDIPSCTSPQILTLTKYGFFCEDLVVDGRLPICAEGEVVVQVDQTLQCVQKQFVRLVCETGHHIVKTGSGYFCQVSEFDVKEECEKGEILLIIGSERICKKLEKNLDLCGDGYKAIRTKDGFVCSSLHLPLECPVGYHILINSDGKPECYPLEDDTPCSGLDGVPCDKGVKLVPCRPGYDVIEGVKGPECELGDFFEVVCNEASQCVAESCKTGYGTRTCQDLLQLVLDGCIPQCSNGGTCINRTCYCPAGVAGGSCEEDIDECLELPEGYCQHGCHNSFGSFECRCPQGSTLNEDGRTCSEIGCIPDCMNGGICVGGVCTCPRGFTGSVCENDINECQEQNGLCEFYCRNTFGSFSCICPPGSRLRDDHRTCMNTTCIPECRNGGKCQNHKCICPTGYYGVICQLDVNECYNGKPCSHECVNTRGSYRCVCPDGQRLQSDGSTCQF